jgi:hypothetical protein
MAKPVAKAVIVQKTLLLNDKRGKRAGLGIAVPV